jgi:hypothetical protein
VIPPRVFIASASDNADVADAIQSLLDRDAECTVSTQGVMRLSRATSDNLMWALDKSDFGIIVFNPGDRISPHRGSRAVARDNVVLELGMFAGRLGIESTFIVVPRGGNIDLPSDLLGLSVADYAADRRDGNLVAAVGPACTRIRQELKLAEKVRQEVKDRVEARIELGDALVPIVGRLAKAADALRRAKAKGTTTRIRRQLKSKVLESAVGVASQVVGTAGSRRACYLELEAGPPMKLVPLVYAGRRAGKRPMPLVAGTENGDHAIRKVRANSPDFYPNLDDDAPPGFDPRRVDYKTFISVPVVAGKSAYGALTADARTAGHLSDVDVDFMAVLAGLVATAMAMSESS